MRSLGVSLAAVFALGSVSCVAPVPAMELGTGEHEFASIEEGADLPMSEGAQGGWHLWLAVHAEGIDPEGARFSVLAYPLGAGHPRQWTAVTRRLTAADGGYEFVGLAAVFSAPECYQDQPTVLEATLTDRHGLELTDRRLVVPRWPTPIGDCLPD